MATATAVRPINRRYDRIFFPAITGLILASVFLGFARSYYLAGLVRAPLPSPLIHIHGAIFSSWLLMLIVQTGLISARRVDIHRRLGLWGMGLATLMVVLGIAAGTDSLRRGFAPGRGPAAGGLDALTFYIIPLTDMALFGTLIYFSYRARRDPAAHKRLVILATIAILDAAIARWPFAFILQSHWPGDLCLYAFLALIAAYDLFTLRRVHRVTIWASALIIIVQQIRVPIGFTPAWHHFAALIQSKV